MITCDVYGCIMCTIASNGVATASIYGLHDYLMVLYKSDNVVKTLQELLSSLSTQCHMIPSILAGPLT